MKNQTKAASGEPGTSERSYTVTHIRPGDEEDIARDVVCAPGRASAALRAKVLFPGSRILAIQPLSETPKKPAIAGAAGVTPSPNKTGKNLANGTHGARFIRGLFRPALFCDERDIETLPE